MSIRDTIEKTTADFGSQVVTPLAERVRDKADHLLDKIGAESAHMGERVGHTLAARIEDLSDAALSRLNLVTMRKARRQTVLGVIIGFLVGATLVRLFTGEAGARRRQTIRRAFNSEPTFGREISEPAFDGEVNRDQAGVGAGSLEA